MRDTFNNSKTVFKGSNREEPSPARQPQPKALKEKGKPRVCTDVVELAKKEFNNSPNDLLK